MIHSNAILIIWGPNSFGGKVKNSKYLFGGKTHQILKWFSMCSTRIPIPNKVFILIYNNHFKHCFYWVRPWQLNSLGRFTHLWNRMNEYQGDCWFQKESSVWIKKKFVLLTFGVSDHYHFGINFNPFRISVLQKWNFRSIPHRTISNR